MENRHVEWEVTPLAIDRLSVRRKGASKRMAYRFVLRLCFLFSFLFFCSFLFLLSCHIIHIVSRRQWCNSALLRFILFHSIMSTPKKRESKSCLDSSIHPSPSQITSKSNEEPLWSFPPEDLTHDATIGPGHCLIVSNQIR